ATVGAPLGVFARLIRNFALRNRRDDVVDSLRYTEKAFSKPFLTGASLSGIGLVLADPGLERTGLEVVETHMIANTLTGMGKRLFGRDRPFTDEGPHSFHFMGGTHDDRRSFPPGAVTSALSTGVPLSAGAAGQ